MKIDQTFKTFDEFQKFRLQWQEDTFQTFTITKSDMFSVAEKQRETLVYKMDAPMEHRESNSLKEANLNNAPES